MPLSSSQITHLADAFNQHWDLPTLVFFAQELNIDLNNEAPSGNLKERAIKLITLLNSVIPSKDRDMLELLEKRGNAALKREAGELLRPRFFSPTGDAHDATMLGRVAFVGRIDLRQRIREFTTQMGPFSTRVIVVKGTDPGGKSYTWHYLRHLAASVAGVKITSLKLKDTGYTPRQLMVEVASLLTLDDSRIPPMTDDPQLARIDSLINWFKGQIDRMEAPYWLVIDDLNDPSVTPAMRQTVYAMAVTVEEKKQNLWLVLLGFNEEITDPDMRYIGEDFAQFPTTQEIAGHFESVAKTSPLPSQAGLAQQIADGLFTAYTRIDKEAMIHLGRDIEETSEKLKQGIQL
jgi:hypothetical protein